MKVYVAGPMRGIKDFNFPEFDAVAEWIRTFGYEVFNPADRDREVHGEGVNTSDTGDLKDIEHTGFSLRDALGADLQWIAAHADAVCVLPGWENSKGAQAEVALACALGLEVWAWDPESRDAPMLDWSDMQPAPAGEVRSVSSTGGEKGVKLARFDLIPTLPLEELAKHYGRGAGKYDDHNWARGYEWSKSYAAMQRHANAFWSGVDIDEETGSLHIVAVAWHAFTLCEFFMRSEYHQFDDRREQR